MSGDCVGCTSTDFHFVWNQSGRDYCGRVARAINGNRCIGGQNLRGHTWCRLCGTLVSEDQGSENATLTSDEPAACTATAEPNIATKDGVKFFRIGAGVPENDNNAIMEWLDGDGTLENLPASLQQYQTPNPDEDST